MKAVRFHGQKDIRVEEVEEPQCGKGQIKVRLHQAHTFSRPTAAVAPSSLSLPCGLAHRYLGSRSNLLSAASVAQIFMNSSVERI